MELYALIRFELEATERLGFKLSFMLNIKVISCLYMTSNLIFYCEPQKKTLSNPRKLAVNLQLIIKK